MEIKQVTTVKDLNDFISFPKALYQNDPNYVCENHDLTFKRLFKNVLKLKTYNAIMAVNNGIILGRVLYQFQYLLKKGKVCFFSHLHLENDYNVFKMLFDHIKKEMRLLGVKCLAGPYFGMGEAQYNGVLTYGFDYPPMYLSPYNSEYMEEFFNRLGFASVTSFSVYYLNPKSVRKTLVQSIASKMERRYSLTIKTCQEVKKEKTDLKAFCDESFVFSPENPVFEKRNPLHDDNNDLFVGIYDKETNAMLGIVNGNYDLNEVFYKKKGKGKLKVNRFKLSMIKGVKLNYLAVNKKYLNTDLAAYLYLKTFAVLNERGIRRIEIGPVLKENQAWLDVLNKVGAEICHTYTIYQKTI